jgi:tetratricopeptide (TPR) repeat protein
MNAGDEAVARNDMKSASEQYARAERMIPDSATNGEFAFWHAVTLANAGRVDESLPLFRRAFAQDSNWVELVRRLPKAGQLPKDEKLIQRILAVRR